MSGPPIVFDRGRLRRLHVWSGVAAVPPLIVLLALLVYLIASLVLGGARFTEAGDAVWDEVVGFPVFTVPAWPVVVLGAVALLASGVAVPGSGVNQLGVLVTIFRWSFGAALASLAFARIFPSSALGTGTLFGGTGDHWIGAASFAASALVAVSRVMWLAPVETALRRSRAIFLLELHMSPQGPEPEPFSLEFPPGWRAEPGGAVTMGLQPFRFVADVEDGQDALEVLVEPLDPGVDMTIGAVDVNGSPVVRAPPCGAARTTRGTQVVHYHVMRPGRTDGATIMTTITAQVAARRAALRAVTETSDRIVETFRWGPPRPRRPARRWWLP